ncbi:protein mono-ADP-ribosyltransferase PARP16 [Toxorhynchites rutilus septentrionalis]|uniref:protein mono-ADP-ribosyltransferase PARP16 n=1 Tax=Toxorhynchites rutilus septentrionalis TaxID=329112 RepID=UPI0024787193|nr:protein mono-ADP-ribosyltransferase PARP16 [Toxorhynchites rutilus septentrionalis]
MGSNGDLEHKRLVLREIIDKDTKAADLRISLFVAAAKSYKYDSCLQPFPPKFLVNKEKNIQKLKRILDELPSLNELELSKLSEDSLHLLHWIICIQNEPGLRTVPKPEFDSILAKAPCLVSFQRPHAIFEVLHRTDAPSEKAFQRNLHQFNSSYAYHGSKLFNFYSILNYGLQQHLNKTALFGEGLYLSAELHVSEMFAPFGSSWSESALGNLLACTVLCEYVDNPAYVKCQIENQQSVIPEKYILIKNNDLVQIRYLLVYGTKRAAIASIKESFGSRTSTLRSLDVNRNHAAPKNRCIRWMTANKSWLLAGGYFLMLFAVGFMNSRNAHYMKQMFMQKINHMCNTLFGNIGETQRA